MNKKRKVLLAILPIQVLCFTFCTNVAYGDVKLNITEEKTEPYSNDSTNTVVIDDDEKTPLKGTNSTPDSIYESNIDKDDDSESKQQIDKTES